MPPDVFSCLPFGPRIVCAGVWRLAVAGVLLLCAALPAGAGEPVGEFSRGVLIRLQGPITPMLRQYLFRKLDAAQAADADLVIVEIHSPGGYLQESLDIARRLRDIDWAHTVAFVPQEALSGAAIAALGCNEILMDPQAKLGDAGPIFQGEDFLFRHAPEKVRSDLARDIRDLAEAKRRPPALAEAMVDMDLVVYRVRNRKSDEVAFMSDAEIEAADDPQQWEKLKPVFESREDKFLEVNGRRAVELKLAEGNVAGRDELKARYRLKDNLLIFQPGGVDTAVYILNLPLVTGLLLVIGLVALYVELSAPGIGVGGLVAGLCFGLFFWSRFLGGTADWLEVILFVSGAAFLLVELFVIPGFGVAGIAGVLLLLTSLIMAGQDFVIPNTGRQLSILTGTLLVVLVSGGVAAVGAYALSSYLGAIPLLNRLTLRPPDASEMVGAGQGTPGSGHVSRRFAVEIGATGVTDSVLRPAGRARFGDDYIDVISEGAYVEEGTRVKVLKISGNRVVVRKVEGGG